MEREIPRPQVSLQDVFDKHEQFEGARPQTVHSTLWYQERLAHELEEWKIEDPTSQEFLSESADVLLFWIGTLRSAGISVEVALQAAIEKQALNEERFPVELFDGTNGLSYAENYAEAKRREGRPLAQEIDIYNPSVLLEEDPRLKID